MRFLLSTLSLSYVRRHRAKTFLTFLGVVVGVATFTAIVSAKTSLLEGMRSTVDRMAGKAHLQITVGGGVPEELQEALWELDGIRAQAPVIQQVIVPEDESLGSVLVLGVDLLGDREMREYGFEGEDVDLDDPLLFLAQADSIALGHELAERAGLGIGDEFAFRTPRGRRVATVRGLLDPTGFAEAYGGNLAVLDVYAAQEMFGRGRRFDRIEVRLEKQLSIDEGTALVAAAVGPGYIIETPARRSAQMQGLIYNFAAGFDLSSLFALGIGTFLIYNAFTVSVNRRRRDIGTLRSLGATPRQVQAMFLLEAGVIGAVGGVVGLVVGRFLTDATLDVMRETVATIYGFHDAGPAKLEANMIVAGLLLGIVASLVGAFLPSRAAAAVHPTSALASGTFRARKTEHPALRMVAGALLMLLAVAAALTRPVEGHLLLNGVVMLGGLATILVVAPISQALLGLASPMIARIAPVAGLLATDSLRSNPRRTSGTVVAMTLAIGFVLGTGGYIHSTRAALLRWMNDLITADLYVRSSANLVRPDFRFPASLKGELLELPGVKAVESYRGMRVPFRDDEILLITIEMQGLMARSSHEFVAGDRESMRRGLVGGTECAISDNLMQRFGVGVGDTIELDTPAGLVHVPVAAVVREFSSDRGAVYLDRAYFLSLWNDDRVDAYDVSVTAGTDPLVVSAAIRRIIGSRMPALISTREQFIAEIGEAVDAFYALMRVTLFLALVVAFLGIVSSLLISVAERTREIGILKSLGALGPQIGRSILCEALAISFVGLLLAIPLGALEARFAETTIAEMFAGWRMPHKTSYDTLLQLAVSLPVVSLLAAWIPARIAAKTPVTEAIEYE